MRFFSRRKSDGSIERVPLSGSGQLGASLSPAQAQQSLVNQSIPQQSIIPPDENDHEYGTSPTEADPSDPVEGVRKVLADMYLTSTSAANVSWTLKAALIDLFTAAHGEPGKVQGTLNLTDKLVETLGTLMTAVIELDRRDLRSGIKVKGITRYASEALDHLKKLQSEIAKLDEPVRQRYPSLYGDLQDINSEVSQLNRDLQKIQSDISSIVYGSDSLTLYQG